MLGQKWLAARIAQVNEQKSDIVILLGDIFEGHGLPDNQLIPALKRLNAPMVVWAVPENHEFQGGGNVSLFQAANFKLMRNSRTEIKPGLALAGLEDLTAVDRNGFSGDLLAQTLAVHTPGAIILLSHIPWETEEAA